MGLELPTGMRSGNPDVDRHRLELLVTFERLLDAMNRGEGRREVPAVLGHLEDLLPAIFRAEEGHFARFPGAQATAGARKAGQDELLGQLQDLLARLSEEGASSQLAIDTCQRLSGWIRTRIWREGSEIRQSAGAGRAGGVRG